MWIEPLVLGVFLLVTIAAIVVAGLATARARAAHARLRAMEGEHRERAVRAGPPGASVVSATPVVRAAPVLNPAPPGPAPPRVQVLVVEDEPGVRELITRTLTRAGREVVTAVGAQTALTALNSRPAIMLMLIDIVLPSMDGYDLAAEARKLAPDMRVVFMSGFARDALRHPSRDGFLSKPFTPEALIAVVDKALAF